MAEDRLVTVYCARSQIDAMIAKSMLDAAGIPYYVKGEDIQELGGLGSLGTFNVLFGPLCIEVLEKDVEEALQVLQPLIDQTDIEESDEP